MADVKPLKLVDHGDGAGRLEEFGAADKVPAENLPATEWAAETVSQAEAEAGTATARRAWTALRVRQAISAWWSSVSTAFGRSLVGAADAAAGRAALGLGTASTTAASAYASAAQGAKADSAAQPGDLAVVATSGAYADLSGLPALGSAAATSASAYATSAQGDKADSAVQPSALTAALSGKVDKASGQSLMTDAERTKLSGIAAGAQANVATNLSQGTRTATAIPLASSTGTGTTLPVASTTLAGLQSAADKTKLDGIATGATANATDAQLRARSGHTGTQAQNTVTNLEADLAAKQATLVSGTSIKTINGESVLGPGDLAIESGAGKLSATNPVIEGSITEDVFALTGTAPELEPDNGTIQAWTLTGNSTPTDGLSTGQSMTLMINDGTDYTITWPSVVWVGGTAPVLAATGQTVVELWKVGSVLYGALVGSVA